MIKHIVFWTLKEHAEGCSKAENIVKVKDALQALRYKIPGEFPLEVGYNFDESMDVYDLALYAEFENKDGLKTYQQHPEHLKVVEFLKKVRDKRAVVDYEI